MNYCLSSRPTALSLARRNGVRVRWAHDLFAVMFGCMSARKSMGLEIVGGGLMSASGKVHQPSEAVDRQISRWVALMPVWVLLRVLALGLPRPHPLRRLALHAFVVHARERAFWLGVVLYATFAVWLRLISGWLSIPATPLFPLSLLSP